MRIMQLVREGSPPPGLRPPQAELSRKSNRIARRRIRRFESDMPSQAVQSLRAMCGLQKYTRSHGHRDSVVFWIFQSLMGWFRHGSVGGNFRPATARSTRNGD
jgi:hypothetical protein